jgi:hypothetical protein
LKRTGGVKVATQEGGKYHFLKEFVKYPVTPQTLFKVSLACKYVFQALQDYSLALHFRKIYLPTIFSKRIADMVKI